MQAIELKEQEPQILNQATKGALEVGLAQARGGEGAATKHVKVTKKKKPVTLADDELAALDEGLRSEQTDRIYTMEEAFEFARKRRQEWTKAKAPAA